MKRHSIIVLLIATAAAFLASGCAARQALEDVKQSKAVYKACLAQHPKDAATACKRQKTAYEETLQAYESMGSGGSDLDANTGRN